jgi:hypothetical protein
MPLTLRSPPRTHHAVPSHGRPVATAADAVAAEEERSVGGMIRGSILQGISGLRRLSHHNNFYLWRVVKHILFYIEKAIWKRCALKEKHPKNRKNVKIDELYMKSILEYQENDEESEFDNGVA